MLKVLIAEDNVMLADLLEDFLTSQGFEVCGIAGTVGQAVMLADLHKPDLAVLDFRLGNGEYGSQIHMLMKNKDDMGILYASGDPLDEKLAQTDGDAYLQKPYGMKDLARALHIVHEMKTTHVPPSAPLPRGFHLLKDASGRRV